MSSEREEACAKERENARIKYEKQFEEIELLHAQKYQRLQNEMEKERKSWLEQESRTKMIEEENMHRQEEKRRREKLACQQLFEAEVMTLKQQHAENIALLKRKWEEKAREELEAFRRNKEGEMNERERQLIEQQRKEKEDDAQNFNRLLSEELKRQHVNDRINVLLTLLYK